MNIDLYSNIKKLCDKKGISVIQLEKDLGFPRSSISKFTNNAPSYLKVLAIARYFETTMDLLVSVDADNYDGGWIRVYRKISADNPDGEMENLLYREMISPSLVQKGEYFGLQAKDDSMETIIKSGDVLIVEKQDTAESGDIVVVIDGENDASCRKLIVHDHGISTMCFNPSYEPQYYSAEEIEENVKVLGKVIEIRRKV